MASSSSGTEALGKAPMKSKPESSVNIFGSSSFIAIGVELCRGFEHAHTQQSTMIKKRMDNPTFDPCRFNVLKASAAIAPI
jgi:hypothetical protein